MDRLLKIVNSSLPDTAIQFRRQPYGRGGIREFLQDLMGMANAAVDGPRYIVVGAEFNNLGERKIVGIGSGNFSGKPAYQSLTADFIEPPIRFSYQPVMLDGKKVGVFEIADCQDRPYMMRVDQSEKLRRGDAYVRVKNVLIKMGRRQLQDLFEQKFSDSVSARSVEIGFAGEIIHKEITIPTTDLTAMPSTVANGKIRQLINNQMQSRKSGSTSVMARLLHTRLFGSDEPYEKQSPEDLMEEMAQLEHKHRHDDQYFLFETNATELQLVIHNQGGEAIEDASLSLVMPDHDAFHVAERPPTGPATGNVVDCVVANQPDYPTVIRKNDVIQVSRILGNVPANAPKNAFLAPLRICVGSELQGRRIGIRYSFSGRNLRRPAKGTLRLILQSQ